MVFRVIEGDEGIVETKPVTLAISNRGEFEAIEGLSAGEEIVAAGVNALKDGARVRRFQGVPN